MNDDHSWEEEQFVRIRLSQSPEWITRIREQLAVLWTRQVSRGIYILGRGRKACAVIWLVINKQFWYYALPYIEPWSRCPLTSNLLSVNDILAYRRLGFRFYCITMNFITLSQKSS
jgi:hypothetical protein